MTVVEGGIRKIFGRINMEKKISQLKDHYVICGFGRIGKVICRDLAENHRPLLVREIKRWTGERRFAIHQLVTRFAERARELRLYVPSDERLALTTTTACLTAMAANYFLTGKFKRVR